MVILKEHDLVLLFLVKMKVMYLDCWTDLM